MNNELSGLRIKNQTNEKINGVNVTIIKTLNNDNKTYYLFNKNNIDYLIKTDSNLEESKVFTLIGNIRQKK